MHAYHIHGHLRDFVVVAPTMVEALQQAGRVTAQEIIVIERVGHIARESIARIERAAVARMRCAGGEGCVYDLETVGLG